MTKVAVYNIEGKKTGDIELPQELFGVDVNDNLLHQVYVALAANKRSGSANTKVRSEVRGGGKKPWKQKGTGNARTGSIRNPIWRGGGIIFGPLKSRNYSKDTNAKMRRKALLGALSRKAAAGKVVVVEDLALSEPKTKTVAAFMRSVSIASRTLFGLSKTERSTYLAARNIERVHATEVEKLNAMAVMDSDVIVLSRSGIESMQNHFTK